MSTTQTPEEIPPFRCPHCRMLEGPIRYGELGYQTQVYDSAEDAWDSSDYGDVDGSYYTDARCPECDEDITDALIAYGRKYPQQSQIPCHFVHEVRVPRSLPLARTRSKQRNPILAVSDADLRRLIDEGTRALGEYYDELTARETVKIKEAAKQAEAAATA